MKTRPGPGPDRKINSLPKLKPKHRQSFPVAAKNQRDAEDQFTVRDTFCLGEVRTWIPLADRGKGLFNAEEFESKIDKETTF
ncbi:unnamed protein product [Brassica oleracea var. botrytis]